MKTTVKPLVKRKNIDFPVDILQKLSAMAATHSQSLKAYIESILIDKANSVSDIAYENPSPSGDPWWDDPENMAAVKKGVAEYKAGRVKEIKVEELRVRYGL